MTEEPSHGAQRRLAQEVCTVQNRYDRLRLEDGPTMTEYATTLSVITFFCLAMFALAAAIGYVT